MEIRKLTEADRSAFAAIRIELFPNDSKDDWAVDHHLSPGAAAFGAFDPDLVGYAAVDLRSHVEGAWERPPGEQALAYLEEWYVRESHRRQGIGRALVAAVREWAMDNRAGYLASDTDIGNETSRAAHEAIGLKEVERAIHFLQPLPVPQKDDLPPIASVELRTLDQKSATDMMQLQTTPAQRRFVAPNVNSLARAFLSDTAWVRGIYAGDVPVGFVMVNLKDTAYLWRFMIDRRYQREGYGRRAMELLIEEMRSLGFDQMLTSYVPAPGGPAAFYRSLGFVETGERDEWEVEAALQL